MREQQEGHGRAGAGAVGRRLGVVRRFAGCGITVLGAAISVLAVQTASAAAAPAGASSAGSATRAAMHVVELQRDGGTGSFSRRVITIAKGSKLVVHTIEYEIRVGNTGNVPLSLGLDAPGCDAGTLQRPSVARGTLTGNVLAPGGVAQFTCSHQLQSDPATFTNTATVTGTPASGSPLLGTSSATVRQHTLGALRVCRTSSGKTISYHGAKPPAACGLARSHG
jgi:hypothetical protein